MIFMQTWERIAHYSGFQAYINRTPDLNYLNVWTFPIICNDI